MDFSALWRARSLKISSVGGTDSWKKQSSDTTWAPLISMKEAGLSPPVSDIWCKDTENKAFLIDWFLVIHFFLLK